MFFATGAAFGKGALQHVFTGAVRLQLSSLQNSRYTRLSTGIDVVCSMAQNVNHISVSNSDRNFTPRQQKTDATMHLPDRALIL